MELRPYQKAAKNAILPFRENGAKRTFLVLPTGCGKAIVFAKIAEERVKRTERLQ